MAAAAPETALHQPIGPLVDARPAHKPEAVRLEGRFGLVEKLQPRHAAALWQAVRGHDQIWTYMSSYGPFDGGGSFSDWVAGRGVLDDPFSYAVVDPNGAAVGIVTLMEIRPAMRAIEVGHIVYSPQLARTRLATEAQFLLARYVFEVLGYRRYEWKCNALNAASRRAAERLGFTFEGILRQHMIAKGRNRDTAYYSLLESEWPARKRAFERWLAPANFEVDGRQIKKLREFAAGGTG